MYSLLIWYLITKFDLLIHDSLTHIGTHVFSCFLLNDVLIDLTDIISWLLNQQG